MGTPIDIYLVYTSHLSFARTFFRGYRERPFPLTVIADTEPQSTVASERLGQRGNDCDKACNDSAILD